ncbi:MAG: zinc-dependent metalloprotease [Cytophagales bacterium]
MNLHILKFITVISLFINFLIASEACFGQKDTKSKDNKSKSDTAKVVVVKKKKSFDDSLKTSKKFSGLFKIYQDSVNGGLLMAIKKDQIDKEYIYFSYSENGFVSGGTTRGMFRDNKVFTIKKYFNRLEFITVNTHYYFDTTNAISKSAEANISNSVLFTRKILDTDKEKGEYLINADDIFLSEYLQRLKPQAPKGLPADAFFSLGSLSKEKSKILKIRNYEQNTDVLVDYVFENAHPSVGGGAEVADERNVSITIQHSLIEIPKNNYKPRFDDARIGYFITQQNDMTSPSATPFHDFIQRWQLEKRDSLAEISEPKVPITWWIENTTPKEYRETIKKATLAWNEAFEVAGFKNAMQVFVQPDTAKWDAGDIKYNVMRWTSSPNPIFGGYGPSFVNPKTGQILGADIMLEYVFVTNRMRAEKFFDPENTNHNPSEFFNELHAAGFCALGEYLQQQNMFGSLALQSAGIEIEKDTFMKQAMYYLVLHELGHTLGLNHNMKASQLHLPSEINNKTITQKVGLIGSVMDYPAANIALDKAKQGDYFTYKPGPYDKWAIEFGYRQFKDSTEEAKGLEKILNRSTEPALTFGNDADDMRSPGVHIDPRVMINDLSGDAIGYSIDRMKLVNKISNELLKKYANKQTAKGKSYQELRNSYNLVMTEKATASTIISRYVGGIYVDRSVIGQKTTKKPLQPVALVDQKRAMEAISKYIFAPEAFKINTGVYNYLQMQRRGFGLYGGNEDPKIHETVLNVQKQILDHWLHPNVLKRLTDSELYGNQYSLSEMMNNITDAIFKADLALSTSTFRQNLQVEYTSRLATAAKNEALPYDHIARANIIYQLRKIETMMKSNPGADEKTKAHRNYLSLIIQKGLAVK